MKEIQYQLFNPPQLTNFKDAGISKILVWTNLDGRHNLSLLIERGLINLPKYGNTFPHALKSFTVKPEVSKKNCKMSIGSPL